MIAVEFPELDQAGHDHLDVDVRRVMAEVTSQEALSPKSEAIKSLVPQSCTTAE